jgi:xylosylprotein 4-beta-galactosyltransferase
MSNRYWGWGREDDDFYLRLKRANIPIERPSMDQVTTGKEYTFQEKQGPNRSRDKKRFQKQKEEALLEETSGLNNLQYAVRNRRELIVDGHPCSVIDVELFCDRMDTHWCNFKYQFDT